jgi:hypothetical protein
MLVEAVAEGMADDLVGRDLLVPCVGKLLHSFGASKL